MTIKLFNLDEAAAFLGVHPGTILAHMHGQYIKNKQFVPPTGLFDGIGKKVKRSWVFTEAELQVVATERERRSNDLSRRRKDNPPPLRRADGRYGCPACGRVLSRQGWHADHKKKCGMYLELQHKEGQL